MFELETVGIHMLALEHTHTHTHTHSIRVVVDWFMHYGKVTKGMSRERAKGKCRNQGNIINSFSPHFNIIFLFCTLNRRSIAWKHDDLYADPIRRWGWSCEWKGAAGKRRHEVQPRNASHHSHSPPKECNHGRKPIGNRGCNTGSLAE